jgi:hypothetical protein
MLRLLFTLLSALSLLLCAATVAAWVDTRSSYHSAQWIGWREQPGPPRQMVWGAAACRGTAWVYWYRMDMLTPKAARARYVAPGLYHQYPDQASAYIPVSLGIVSLDMNGADYRSAGSECIAPCWLLAATSAVLPAAWLVSTVRRRHRTRHRLRSRLCLKCGYDLRASPGPCPECGRSPPTVKV